MATSVEKKVTYKDLKIFFKVSMFMCLLLLVPFFYPVTCFWYGVFFILLLNSWSRRQWMDTPCSFSWIVMINIMTVFTYCCPVLDDGFTILVSTLVAMLTGLLTFLFYNNSWIKVEFEDPFIFSVDQENVLSYYGKEDREFSPLSNLQYLVFFGVVSPIICFLLSQWATRFFMTLSFRV